MGTSEWNPKPWKGRANNGFEGGQMELVLKVDKWLLKARSQIGSREIRKALSEDVDYRFMSQQMYTTTQAILSIYLQAPIVTSCAQDCQHSTIIYNKLLLKWLAVLQNTADNRFKLKRLLCIPESDVQRTHAKNTNFQKTMHSIAMDRLSKTNTKLCLYERSWTW
jgi:transposase